MIKLEQRISLRHLRLLDAIEREGSMATAAIHLNMTQSAVTKALQEVEKLTGAVLFRRTSRGAVPTPVGRILVGHARTVIAQLRHASRELDGWMEGHGSVVIGTLPSAAGGLLPKAITSAMAVKPKLRISIVEGQHDWLTNQLRRSDLDLVVGRLPRSGAPADFAHEVLGPDRAQLVVRSGHPLSRNPTLTLADLHEGPWILPPSETSLRRQIDTAFQEAALAPPVPHVESMSFLCNRTLLLASDFITVWPHHLAEVEGRSGLVAVLPVELPATERPIGVWWRTELGLSSSAELIVKALKETALAGSRRTTP